MDVSKKRAEDMDNTPIGSIVELRLISIRDLWYEDRNKLIGKKFRLLKKPGKINEDDYKNWRSAELKYIDNRPVELEYIDDKNESIKNDKSKFFIFSKIIFIPIVNNISNSIGKQHDIIIERMNETLRRAYDK